MFRAARNRLVDDGVLTKDDALSYFVECLLYNVPNQLFKPKLAPIYTGTLDWLKTAKLKEFPRELAIRGKLAHTFMLRAMQESNSLI